MTLNEIKRELVSERYNFLKDDPHLGSNIILLGLGVRRHIVGGANRTLFSLDLPPRLCRTGT